RDPAVVGSSVEMNRFVYTIVGVLPEIPPYPHDNEVWVPASNDWVMSDARFVADRSTSAGLVSHVIGKLDAGVSLEQARQDAELFAVRLRSAYPDVYREESGYTISVQPLKTAISRASATTVGLLMSLAAL